MRLVSYRAQSTAINLGVIIDEDTVLDVSDVTGACTEFSSMLSLIEAGQAALTEVRNIGRGPIRSRRRLQEIQLVAPIQVPPRFRALSLDPLHLRQAADGRLTILERESIDPEVVARARATLPDMPAAGWYDTPIYWLMDHHCISGPNDVVEWPNYSDWIDYELEIAAVIGKSGRDIAVEDAADYIFGFTIMNDLSARDAQIAATATGLSITAKGKDFTGSYALGPCIVTADDINPAELDGVLRVNGETWGEGSTRGGHWTFEHGISYASQASDLIPGEILSSSTVAGCSGIELARKGARGDVVELEVAGIGTLRTYIR